MQFPSFLDKKFPRFHGDGVQCKGIVNVLAFKLNIIFNNFACKGFVENFVSVFFFFPGPTTIKPKKVIGFCTFQLSVHSVILWKGFGRVNAEQMSLVKM